MNQNFSEHVHKPEIIGPGYWSIMHSYGYNATTEEGKKRFYDYIYYLCDYFPCNKCKPHIVDYVKKHPLEEYWNVTDSTGRPIGMFKWSWMIHNHVNAWLKKPIIDFETAFKIYDPHSEACSNCTNDEKAKPKYPPLSTFIAQVRVNSPRNHFQEDIVVPVFKELDSTQTFSPTQTQEQKLKIVGK